MDPGGGLLSANAGGSGTAVWVGMVDSSVGSGGVGVALSIITGSEHARLTKIRTTIAHANGWFRAGRNLFGRHFGLISRHKGETLRLEGKFLLEIIHDGHRRACGERVTLFSTCSPANTV